MRIYLKPGVLDELQKSLGMSDESFSAHLGVSRSQLWRARLPQGDSRFSLGETFVAKILQAFPQKQFEDIFFLDQVSHACDDKKISTA